jgi:hypothetical protein
VNHHRQNEGILRYASTLPAGVVKSLCFGGDILVSFPDEKVEDKTYYVSVFEASKTIGVGERPTLMTVGTYDNLGAARKEARRLAGLWGWETVLECLRP